jgi:hypothetical protein
MPSLSLMLKASPLKARPQAAWLFAAGIDLPSTAATAKPPCGGLDFPERFPAA